jgi:hypothetical protein
VVIEKLWLGSRSLKPSFTPRPKVENTGFEDKVRRRAESPEDAVKHTLLSPSPFEIK